jgi:anti-sigma factor RsiW
VTLQHPQAELSAYIDRALAPAAQAAVAEHVAACAVCRAHVSELRATVALVQALPDPVPSRRLVPRLAPAGPAWLAPLRTVMTLASGTAVFLFIASSLLSNITFLASGSATSAQAGGRDTTNAFQVQAPTAEQASAPTRALGPVPSASPNPALARNPTSPPFGAAAEAGSSPAVDDAAKRSDQATVAPAPGAAVGENTGRPASSEPQRSPLVNPWLWLTVAILCGAIAIALQRRLHRSI